MSRRYTKVEILSQEVLRRKAAGETNREIGESYGLTKEQVKNLVKRQSRKQRPIAEGYIPQHKRRPQKTISEKQKRNNELIELHMQVELLRNFLYEAGRG
jgi:predicted transcriptional regulator